MLRERRGSPFAIAVVDEPFGSLDQRNRAELARTFAAMLGSVGLEQAFVVSHDEALLSALPSKIVIMRDGKRSSAEVV
jgi:DNA repair exonuclease SbcCD ATPase subunit